MKHLITTFGILLLSANTTWADNVNRESAKLIAQRVLGGTVAEGNEMTATLHTRLKAFSTAAPAFHVFNATDSKGFVIVSGEDSTPEILAYSHTSDFSLENAHPSLVALLQTYTDIIEDIRSGNATSDEYFSTESRTHMRHKAVSKPVVGPLCECNWGQEEPYNTLCPEDNGVRCPVGCVATAMAQIMYHHKWPLVGEGSAKYASGLSGVGVIGSDFSQHHYNWESMLLDTESNLASPEAAEAVAQLSYDCGIASKMQYGASGSGTYDEIAMNALSANFGYRASTLTILRRDCYATQDEWNAIVKSYLDNSSPVLYGGHGTTGGHEFIIDGYDDGGLFHVNWGWDGYRNGYYSIVTLKPQAGVSYGSGQSMVCGIEPDYEGTDKTRQQWRLYVELPHEVKYDSIAIGSKFDVSAHSVFNITNFAKTWKLAIALYDLEGNQLEIISSRSATKNKEQILSYKGFATYNISSTIPADTPDGAYSLRFVACEDGYDEYLLPQMVGGSDLNNLYITVNNGIVYFNSLPAAIEHVRTDSPSSSPSSLSSSTAFNLSGQRVTSSYRGIVIKSGKKYVR